MLIYILTAIVILVLTACSYITFSPTFGASPKGESLERIKNSPNYDGKKFKNLEPTSVMVKDADAGDFSMFDLMFPPKDRVPQKPLPSYKFDKENVVDGTFTWLGHSTLLMQVSGKNILIDPVFYIASPVPFVGKPYEIEYPIKQDELPEIDIILISHNHYDHLDYKAIKKFGNNIKKYFVPLGNKQTLMRWGIEESRIEEFDWYENIDWENINFILTPSRHFSGRSFTDRAESLWGGWIISSGEKKIYFTGDGGYSKEFKSIGDKYGPFDIVFVENGAYNKRWGQIHMFPEQAVQACIDSKAKLVVPVHWGKFNLAPHNWDDSIIRFTKEALAERLDFATPMVGKTFTLNTPPEDNWWEENYLSLTESSDINGGEGSETKETDKMKIRITINNKTISAVLEDNPSARDFYSQLPLETELKDYAGTEKITYLPKKLSTKDAPAGYDPSVGDITYYSPWGNVAIFYKDFGYAGGLISLGKITDGIELLQNSNNLKVIIEVDK